MDPLFALDIALPARDSRQRLRALHRQLRTAILDGRLRGGLRLPATRLLAATHGVARNTAVAAYEMLVSEGYAVARRGSGTFVAELRSGASRPRSARPPLERPTCGCIRFGATARQR